MMSNTFTPATMSASVINRRWHLHGTASLHMIAGTDSFATRSSSASPEWNSAVAM
jgi:hypothetical protein